MKLLEVKNLSVKLDNKIILNNINFYVNKGEIVSIIGPNGAGKTTLLKAILGLLDCEGVVKYKNDNIKKYLNEIEYIPQSFNFLKDFPITVEEFLKLRYIKEKDYYEKIVKEIGVYRFLSKKIGDISGGELQRVLICRALINKPELILMDEPTAGIDIEGEKSFYEILNHLNKVHKITVIFVSHELNIVLNFAQKVICVNKNLICFGNVPEEMTQKTIELLYGKDYTFKLHNHEN